MNVVLFQILCGLVLKFVFFFFYLFESERPDHTRYRYDQLVDVRGKIFLPILIDYPPYTYYILPFYFLDSVSNYPAPLYNRYLSFINFSMKLNFFFNKKQSRAAG